MGSYAKVHVMDSTNYNIEQFHRAMVVESKYPDMPWKADARFSNLDNAIAHIDTDGLVLEFGVSRGTTINHIAKKLPNQTVYGFDSFEGLPEDWNGVCKKEHFLVKGLPKVDKNTTLIKGWFNDTLDLFLKNNPDIVIDMIHIDCDLYSSTKDVFNILIKHNKSKLFIITCLGDRMTF